MSSSNQFNRQSGAASGSGGFGVKKINRNKTGRGVEVNALIKSEIAHLWPTIANLTALQKECIAALPHLFIYCQVLHLESEQLVVAAPNSAVASKLKQLLPKLMSALQKAGWQINAIRIKVQVNPVLEKEAVEKQCQFSRKALSAFDELEKNLSGSKGNDGLLQALRALLNRNR
jgi:hypothetical protein